ncbi:cytochrome P450 [Halovulum marinum]|uniref:cytochrome P450 n=1 Tax=Halovulum marinum TaxID=2662447 RepID=UPI001F32DC9A|nr:cytochrome P450 [Halovulum marinum]
MNTVAQTGFAPAIPPALGDEVLSVLRAAAAAEPLAALRRFVAGLDRHRAEGFAAQPLAEASRARLQATLAAQLPACLERLRAAPRPDLIADFVDPLFAGAIAAAADLPAGAADALQALAAHLRQLDPAVWDLADARALERLLRDVGAPGGGAAFAGAAPAAVAADLYGAAQALAAVVWDLLLRDNRDWAATQAENWDGAAAERALARAIRGLMAGAAPAAPAPGATLEAVARLMTGLAVPALASRFPRMYLLRSQAEFRSNAAFHAPAALPCDPEPVSGRSTAKLWDIKDYATARGIATDLDAFTPPDLTAFLEQLQQITGRDLESGIRFSRNAMFFMSGPRHAQARKIVADVLGTNRLRAWQPVIDDAVRRAVDRFAAADAPDLVHDFAMPVFRNVTKPVLGVLPRDAARFDAVAPDLQDILAPIRPLRELVRLNGIFSELLRLARDARAPDPAHPLSVADGLRQAGLENFDHDDSLAFVLVLYGASFNIAHTLSNALHWTLSLNPEERRGIEDPAWINGRLEQIIALCASQKYIFRIAGAAQSVDGLAFGRGDTVRINVTAVNNSMPSGYMTFGHGLRRCLGASLSKVAIRTAIPALFRRFPDLRVEPQGLRYLEYPTTVALEALPARR